MGEENFGELCRVAVLSHFYVRLSLENFDLPAPSKARQAGAGRQYLVAYSELRRRGGAGRLVTEFNTQTRKGSRNQTKEKDNHHKGATMQPRYSRLCIHARHLGLAIAMTAATAGAEPMTKTQQPWRQSATDYAGIMSQLEWTPVADGIPIRGKREFQANKTYTGVPYSNGGHDGRYIGFDIFLKTFLAAVENPRSVLYTKDLRGQRRNAAAFYGMVCSSYTSYALQLAMPVGSSWQGPPHRQGIEAAQPQSAQGARAGDILWFRGHVEIVTQVTTTSDGTVTHVRVEDSCPPTTRTKNYTASEFEAYLAQRKATLYRITDHDAWRGDSRAERFLFPDYAMDAAPPTINRVLLLDLGDWVVYHKGQPVQFNIMDRDNQGVDALVIKREDEIVEQVALEGPGMVERAFTHCGNYTAYCIMRDGSSSQACEFSVCEIDVTPPDEAIALGKPWKIEFHAGNMHVIHVGISPVGDPNYSDPVPGHGIWLTDEQRRAGSVVVPADALARAGNYSVRVTGENRYGRLRNRRPVTIVADAP